MRNVGIARSAKLVVVALGSDFERAPHRPGVFRRPVGSQLFEKLFQAGVELPLGPVPVKVERDIGRRRHAPVYQKPALNRFFAAFRMLGGIPPNCIVRAVQITATASSQPWPSPGFSLPSFMLFGD